jgi:hypothetical protein
MGQGRPAPRELIVEPWQLRPVLEDDGGGSGAPMMMAGTGSAPSVPAQGASPTGGAGWETARVWAYFRALPRQQGQLRVRQPS